MGKKQLDDLEPDGPITLSILEGIVWDFTQREMLDVMEDREVWRLNLKLLPKADNAERKREWSRFSVSFWNFSKLTMDIFCFKFWQKLN